MPTAAELMNMQPGDGYTCEMCGQPFVATRQPEACIAEMESVFKKYPDDEDLAVICDDCWQKIHPQRN